MKVFTAMIASAAIAASQQLGCWTCRNSYSFEDCETNGTLEKCESNQVFFKVLVDLKYSMYVSGLM